MTDLDEFYQMVGFLQAAGLTESQAYALAEETMEAPELLLELR